jgi:lipopolysaccharide export system protein LptA
MTARMIPRLVLVAPLILAAHAAAAQIATGVPNALQGFSVNREQPVHITSKSLEVRDKEKRATFMGDVHVAQGDTTMKSNTLDVFYDQEANPTPAKPVQRGGGAQPAADGQQQIRRLEAKGNVVVTKLDQTATGETAIFDTAANTVTLSGSVVVTQGGNVLRGELLVVNLTTGVSRFEGRVQGLLLPNSARKPPSGDGDAKPNEAKPNDAKPGAARADASRAKDAPKPPARPAPAQQPLRLN